MKIFKLAAAAASTVATASKFGATFASSAFEKTVTAAKRTFDSSRVRKDVLSKLAAATSADASITAKRWRGMGNALRTKAERTKTAVKNTWNRTPSPVRKLIGGGAKLTGYVAGARALSVGAIGMMAVGIMHGMNNAAKDIMLERYMQDQRYSRNILLQSRVGLSMGSNQMNRMGSTMGLSNSLSKTRHGARY